MFTKKLFTVLTAAFMICGFNANAFAELFSVSAGIPVSHTFSNTWGDSGEKVESDGVSGALVHVKFPIMVGVGYENYETKIKAPTGANFENMKLATNMFDVFYLLPVPIVNITLGVGLGSTTLSCNITDGRSCSDVFESGSMGSAYQLWGQFGFPIFPFLDLHLSYHSVTAKAKAKIGSDWDFNGNLIGFGAAFIF